MRSFHAYEFIHWYLEEREEGAKVTIEKSKTDQEAQGQAIATLRLRILAHSDH